MLLPLNANLDLKFAVLQAGPSYYDLPRGYHTIEQAQADGAVVMAYGVFLNKTLNFVGLGSALYALAGLYQYLSKDPIIKHMVKCRYCRKRINEKVSVSYVVFFGCPSWRGVRVRSCRQRPLTLLTIVSALCKLHQLVGWARGEHAGAMIGHHS